MDARALVHCGGGESGLRRRPRAVLMADGHAQGAGARAQRQRQRVHRKGVEGIAWKCPREDASHRAAQPAAPPEAVGRGLPHPATTA